MLLFTRNVSSNHGKYTIHNKCRFSVILNTEYACVRMGHGEKSPGCSQPYYFTRLRWCFDPSSQRAPTTRGITVRIQNTEIGSPGCSILGHRFAKPCQMQNKRNRPLLSLLILAFNLHPNAHKHFLSPFLCSAFDLQSLVQLRQTKRLKVLSFILHPLTGWPSSIKE